MYSHWVLPFFVLSVLPALFQLSILTLDTGSTMQGSLMLSLCARRAISLESRVALTRAYRVTPGAMGSGMPVALSLRSSPTFATSQPIHSNFSPSTSTSSPAKAWFSSSRAVGQAEQEGREEEKEMDDGEKNIFEILTREFQPAQLQVQDVSGECLRE